MENQILTIYGKLDNLNDYTKACRSNKFAGAECKKRNEKIVSFYILQQLKGVKFTGRVRLEFKWYEPNRKRDIDNICFAKKFILDSLVTNQIIECDGWRGVEGFTDTFFIDKDVPRIEVTISEVKENGSVKEDS